MGFRYRKQPGCVKKSRYKNNAQQTAHQTEYRRTCNGGFGENLNLCPDVNQCPYFNDPFVWVFYLCVSLFFSDLSLRYGVFLNKLQTSNQRLVQCGRPKKFYATIAAAKKVMSTKWRILIKLLLNLLIPSPNQKYNGSSFTELSFVFIISDSSRNVSFIANKVVLRDQS